MDKNSRILIVGGTGQAGGAILRVLLEKGYSGITATRHRHPASITGDPSVEFVPLDALDSNAVNTLFRQHHPEYVFLTAALVGGIMANNTVRARFIFENLEVQNNIIHQSHLHGVKKLLFLGSSCIYPREAPQPIREDSLLTGPLEYTNEPYAVAKIAGLKMCEAYNQQYGCNFICAMPTNLYGPGENFDLNHGHVLAAITRKFYLAKCLADDDFKAIRNDLLRRGAARQGQALTAENITALSDTAIKDWLASEHRITRDGITLWGTGNPKREFLHNRDLAEACVFIMEKIDFKDLAALTTDTWNSPIRNTHVNVGTGRDHSIREIAGMLKAVSGYPGDILFDPAYPDGTMLKRLNVERIRNLGWQAKISLEDGLEGFYREYAAN